MEQADKPRNKHQQTDGHRTASREQHRACGHILCFSGEGVAFRRHQVDQVFQSGIHRFSGPDDRYRKGDQAPFHS